MVLSVASLTENGGRSGFMHEVKQFAYAKRAFHGPSKSRVVAEAEFIHAGVSFGDYGVSWRQSQSYSLNTVTSSFFAQ